MIGTLRILKEMRTVTFKLVDRIVGRVITILGVKLIEMTRREFVEGMGIWLLAGKPRLASVAIPMSGTRIGVTRNPRMVAETRSSIMFIDERP